jgi:hypothetical protein
LVARADRAVTLRTGQQAVAVDGCAPPLNGQSLDSLAWRECVA